MERAALFAGCLLLVCALSGCGFLMSSEREYISNGDLLEEIAVLSRYPVDAGLFKLTRIDMRDDSITYQFRGVQFVGDHAWVVRYSEKSSEQNPVDLVDLNSLLPVISEGKSGFDVLGEGEEEVGGHVLRYIRYRFDSPIGDGQGRPLPGRGIVGSVHTQASGGALVYQIKLDNHGDRAEVTWEVLEPFVESIIE
jgi:hypothetical protein